MPAQDLLHAFPNQESTEAVYVFARPYWFTFLPTAFLFVFIFFFSIALQYIVATYQVSSVGVANGIILALGIFQLFALTVFMIAILDFYYDITIVTDRRLASLTQEQLFYRKFSQLNLEEVEDVNAIVKGFFQTTLNYGQIQVQTAGEQENFIIPNLRFPNEIVSIISSLANQAKDGIPEENRIPKTRIVGVIDGNEVATLQELAAIGAMVPEDLRLTVH